MPRRAHVLVLVSVFVLVLLLLLQILELLLLPSLWFRIQLAIVANCILLALIVFF